MATSTSGRSTRKTGRRCSACGATEAQEPNLIELHGEWLCPSCVREQREFLASMAEELRQAEEASSSGARPSAARRVPSPKEIKAFLDQYVVGQDACKRILAVAVHNHYKRIENAGAKKGKGKDEDVELEKSNILLVGPTGSGKTLLARTLARMLDVPFAIADATTLTEAGYVGEDVENILLNLIQAADMDVRKAEKGIVFVDEIDKIARKTSNVSITRDVSGEGVQQALLKIVEGTLARVPPAGGRKHPEQKYIEIQTKDILFICGGAFVGLDKVMKRRSDAAVLGFGADDAAAPGGAAARKRKAAAKARPEPEDFVEFGLIPEFIGRLPVVATLDELTEDDLVRILSEPKNALLKQYQKLFRLENVELSFDEGAARELAKEALARKTGARGLRAIMEELMTDLMFELAAPSGEESPARSLRVTAELVRSTLDGEGSLAAALAPASAAPGPGTLL